MDWLGRVNGFTLVEWAWAWGFNEWAIVNLAGLGDLEGLAGLGALGLVL